MSPDDAVPPVTSTPVDEGAPLPAVPAARPGSSSSGVGYIGAPPSAGGAAPAEEALAPGVLRAQIATDAVAEPRSVEVRATVHDAAVHGSDIARAIERAQRGQDAQVVNQQLGGAAASAASGQAAQVERTRPPEERDEIPSLDPLAATPRIGDQDGGRQRRHEDESGRAAGAGEEGSVEDPVQQDR